MSDSNPKSKMFLDDAAGMVGGIAGIVADMRSQIKDDMQSRMKSFADQSELASLDDVQRLEAMINDISNRLEALETQNAKSKTNKASSDKT